MSGMTVQMARMTAAIALALIAGCGRGERAPAQVDSTLATPGDSAAGDSTANDTKTNIRAFLGEGGQAPDTSQ